MTDATESTEEKQELTLRENLRLLLKASRGFWLVNQINFFDGIAYFGILMLLTRYLGPSGLGMSDQVTGLSVSAYTGLVTLFMFGGGFVSDRLGVRRALTWSLIVIGAGRVLLSGAPFTGESGLSYIVSWAGLLLMALGTGVMQPALYAGIKEYTDPRTATMGYGLLYSIMNLGIVAESFISPFLRSDATFLNLGFAQIVGLGWGINGVYWTAVAITGLMLLIHMTFFTRQVEETDRTVIAEVEEGESDKTLMEKIKELPFADPRFMFFIFILLPVRTIFAHDFLTVPDYVFRCFPEAVSAKYEWIHGMNPLIIVIFVPTIAALTRKVRIIHMMIVGTSITAIIPFILVPGPHLWTLLTYVTIYSLGEAVWSSRFLEYVAELAPAGRVGAYMGLAGIPWFLAKFTTGLYSGSMIAHFIPEGGPHNSGTMWLIYAFIACISPITLMAARKWLIKGVMERR